MLLGPDFANTILEVINTRLGLALVLDERRTFVAPPKAPALICVGPTGITHAVVGYLDDWDRYMVRSVLRTHRKRGEVSWMPNGQVVKGRQLVHFAEGDVTVTATHAQQKAAWVQDWKDWQELRAGGFLLYADERETGQTPNVKALVDSNRRCATQT